MNDKPGEYGQNGQNFMKIESDSDDNLSFNKLLKLHNLTIALRSVFQEVSKNYPQMFLDECLYEL